MPKKKVQIDARNSKDVIKTKDKTRSYPLDMLMDLFIHSDATLQQIATEYDLPLSHLMRIAKTGKTNWLKLKASRMKTRLEYLAKQSDNSLVETQSIYERMEKVHRARLHMDLDKLEKHLERYGDFHMRDAEGKIILGSYGKPLNVYHPVNTREIALMKALAEAKDANEKRIMSRMKSSQLPETEVEEPQGIFLPEDSQ